MEELVLDLAFLRLTDLDLDLDRDLLLTRRLLLASELKIQ